MSDAGHTSSTAYARLGIACVLVANAMAYQHEPSLTAMFGMLFAAAAAGMSYLSQCQFNQSEMTDDPDGSDLAWNQAVAWQWAAIASATASGFIALVCANG